MTVVWAVLSVSATLLACKLVGWAVDRMAASLAEARREQLAAGERPALSVGDSAVDERQRRRELWEWNHPGRLTEAQLDEIEFYREPIGTPRPVVVEW